MLSPAQKTVMRKFRQFRVGPGKMLCFYGPDLERNRAALQELTANDLLVEESFSGAYSLTPAGFEAMKACSELTDAT